MFDDMKVSAVIFDIIQIQFKGLKAKTNFSYSFQQVMAILSLGCMLDFKKFTIGPNKCAMDETNMMVDLMDQ